MSHVEISSAYHVPMQRKEKITRIFSLIPILPGSSQLLGPGSWLLALQHPALITSRLPLELQFIMD